MKSRNRIIGLSLLVVFCGHIRAMDQDDEGFQENFQVAQEASIEQKPSTGSVSSLAWEPDTDRQDTLKEADVTTLDEARGNWFFKAKILKDARKVYDGIRKKLTKIAPLEDSYAEKRNKLDGLVNVFYQEYGFQQGEADERLDILIEEVKKLEDSEGILDKDERNLLEQLKEKKNDVEAVKTEFDELHKLNNALNQALVTLAGQINKANTYDEQAWQGYEQIELTLSDERAQEVLNKIQNNLDNITAIEKYLTNDFAVFFEKSTKAINAHVEKIKTQVLDLKEQGIGLGKKMAELIAKEEAIKQEQAERERDQLKKELAAARKTWWSWFTDSITSFFESMYNFVAAFFTSQPKAEKVGISVEMQNAGSNAASPTEPVVEPESFKIPEESTEAIVVSKQIEPVEPLPEAPAPLPFHEAATAVPEASLESGIDFKTAQGEPDKQPYLGDVPAIPASLPASGMSTLPLEVPFKQELGPETILDSSEEVK
jgi:archaellum component FlaC